MRIINKSESWKWKQTSAQISKDVWTHFRQSEKGHMYYCSLGNRLIWYRNTYYLHFSILHFMASGKEHLLNFPWLMFDIQSNIANVPLFMNMNAVFRLDFNGWDHEIWRMNIFIFYFICNLRLAVQTSGVWFCTINLFSITLLHFFFASHCGFKLLVFIYRVQSFPVDGRI